MKGDPKVAASYFKQAEDIFSKSSNNMFLIGVHYTWATLLMNQNENLDALAKFQVAYTLAKESIPFQTVVASLCYKLAVLHTRMDLFKEAKERLKEGMTISENHKREEFIARIGRQWALTILTIDADPTSTDEEKDMAAEMKKTSEDIRQRLWEQINPYVKDASNVQEEEQYRWLLAAWYR
ncbi:hypothetical protein EJ04DRAFT_560814 [Polyplosphaeria fusca]|uniref:Uncharacterized protein n=1 Tax=Polyplosphaeria fusca TaxID=682080 RepID=A0A9P4V4Y6_9PLEO|nr:hypothetical protein EJ04DRAFT_560814 [Polyplosphaeria fusca]